MHVKVEFHDWGVSGDGDRIEDFRAGTLRLFDSGGYEVAMLEKVAIHANLLRSIDCFTGNIGFISTYMPDNWQGFEVQESKKEGCRFPKGGRLPEGGDE